LKSTSKANTDLVVPVAPSRGRLRPLGLDEVRITGGFWARRREVNATATLDHCRDWMDRVGWTGNFSAPVEQRRGREFADSDVYKLLEAMAWAGTGLGTITETIASAQEPDGYLNTAFGRPGQQPRYSDLEWGHELYCYGHLIQAGVAQIRTRGEGELAKIAQRAADHVCAAFGPGGIDGVCGHPEIETALVELFRVTGHRPYLDLAARFVDRRGHGLLGSDRFGPRYFQDHVPVRDAPEVAGHVVRQVYLLAGAVDVAVETGDHDLLRAAERLWDSAQSSRTYITGGQGSRHRDEAFGDAYELPPDRAYAETCAAIGSFQWAWRLLLATGRSRYADEMERLLYNGIAASTASGGTAFFYSNPLQLRTGHDGSEEDAPSQRLPWYSCACCPPNLARLMASLHTYAATGGPDGLQLHLYGSGTFTAGGQTVRVQTSYPWSETVSLTVTDAAGGPWTLALRVPSWCTDARLTVNGSLVRAGAQEGCLRLTRTWHEGDRVELTLAMPPRLITGHPRVDAVRGTVALARGPVVHCLEHADLPAPLAGEVFEDLYLDASSPVVASDQRLHAAIRSRETGAEAIVPTIPYFQWANRAPGPMRVWIPLA
jgi:uncharacterized protein